MHLSLGAGFPFLARSRLTEFSGRLRLFCRLSLPFPFLFSVFLLIFSCARRMGDKGRDPFVFTALPMHDLSVDFLGSLSRALPLPGTSGKVPPLLTASFPPRGHALSRLQARVDDSMTAPARECLDVGRSGRKVPFFFLFTVVTAYDHRAGFPVFSYPP